MGEVVTLTQQITRPVRHVHKGVEIILNFDMEDHMWHWEFHVKLDNTFTGKNGILEKALKQSAAQIDTIYGTTTHTS